MENQVLTHECDHCQFCYVLDDLRYYVSAISLSRHPRIDLEIEATFEPH